MEATQKTRGIVLHREAYNEHDFRVFLYTQDFGKLNLVARGTQKISSKLAGHLEPLNLVEIMIVKGKQYDYLGSAVNIAVFKNIKNNYEKLILAGEGMSVIARAIKDREADMSIYQLIIDWLNVIDSCTLQAEKSQLLRSALILRLLEKLGYTPQLYSCTHCKKNLTPQNNHFSAVRGGVICSNCNFSDARVVLDDVIKTMRFLLQENLNQIDRFLADIKVINTVNDATDEFYKYRVS